MNPAGSEEAPNSAGRSADSPLQPILDSALLRKAPAQRKLLLYLWDRRHDPPSEYSIGIDVFGRKPEFDPKTDSTVRVQVSRLRQRLKEFYEQEGASDRRRIVIPLGEYRADLCDAPAAPSLPEPTERESRPEKHGSNSCICR